MYKHILVPVVLDDPARVEAAFRAVRVLGDVEARFTVLHVIEALPPHAAVVISENILRKIFNDAEDALEKIAADLPGAEANLVRGHAGRQIVRFADENEVDCIVMQSHKPGLENYFIGSTADRVVRHASCCVHVIR